MNASEETSRDDLVSFAKSLNKEQADILILNLPKVIAILEAQGERFQQIQFRRIG
jgi:hypothetical protein